MHWHGRTTEPPRGGLPFVGPDGLRRPRLPVLVCSGSMQSAATPGEPSGAPPRPAHELAEAGPGAHQRPCEQVHRPSAVAGRPSPRASARPTALIAPTAHRGSPANAEAQRLPAGRTRHLAVVAAPTQRSRGRGRGRGWGWGRGRHSGSLFPAPAHGSTAVAAARGRRHRTRPAGGSAPRLSASCGSPPATFNCPPRRPMRTHPPVRGFRGLSTRRRRHLGTRVRCAAPGTSDAAEHRPCASGLAFSLASSKG